MLHRSTRLVVVLLACAGMLGAWLALGVELDSVSTARRGRETLVVLADETDTGATRSNALATSPTDSAREAPGDFEGPAPVPPEEPGSRNAFRGLVLDGRTQQPLEGVGLFWRGAEFEPPTAGTSLESAVTTTGADGHFELERRSGRVVWLLRAGYGALGFTLPASETMVPPFERRDERSSEEGPFAPPAERKSEFPPDAIALFQLYPPATLELVLDGRWDAPCREMRVQLRELPTPVHASAPEGIRLFQVLHEGRFDAEGRVRFEGVRALAPHTVLLGARDLELALEAATSRVSTFTILCGLVPLDGVATDPSGRALEGVAIEASSSPPAESDQRASLRIRTDGAGRFGYASLTAGTWWLHARSEDGRFGTLEQVELVDAPVQLRLVLAPTLILSGSALRADGQPGSGEVWARAVAHPEHFFDAPLGSDGNFRLEVWLDEEFEVGLSGLPGSTQRTRLGRGELLFIVPVAEPPATPANHQGRFVPFTHE